MKLRKWLFAVLSALLILSLTACGADGMATDEMIGNNTSNDMSMESETGLYGDSSDTGSTPEDNRKWIVTVYMDAETEDLDALLSQLGGQIRQLSGYVEDQNIYNGSSYSSRRYRSASLTIRIPADQVDAFTTHVADISNIISSNKSLEDVTLSYVATESRMNALQAEEERLLELMAQAENMSDLLEIEARLTDVRYELERVTSQLRLYDNQIDYATIYLNIEEVQEYTPTVEKTVWQRISEGFMDSLDGLWNMVVELFVFVLVSSPYLVVIAGIVVLIIFLAKRDAKKRKAAQKPPFPPQQPPFPPQPPQAPQNKK